MKTVVWFWLMHKTVQSVTSRKKIWELKLELRRILRHVKKEGVVWDISNTNTIIIQKWKVNTSDTKSITVEKLKQCTNIILSVSRENEKMKQWNFRPMMAYLAYQPYLVYQFYLFCLQESLRFGGLYWKLGWRANVFGTPIRMGTTTRWRWAWRLPAPLCTHMPLLALLSIPKALPSSTIPCMLARSRE